MNLRKIALAAAFAPLFATTAHAALMVTYAESPSIYNSTLPGTTVFTFDNGQTPWGSKSSNVVWTSGGTTIGTYDNVYVKGADAYGGAGPSGSGYIVQSTTVGGASAVPVTTLTLNGDYAYFGFWWSAGDGNNVITFSENGSVVAQFTTATLLDKIANDAAYKGNPRTHANTGESYAYINFFGLEGTAWNSITFSNTTSTTGFESDNHTVRKAPYNPTTDGPMPGIPLAIITGTTVTEVPEPGVSAFAVVLAGVLFARRRRH